MQQLYLQFLLEQHAGLMVRVELTGWMCRVELSGWMFRVELGPVKNQIKFCQSEHTLY